MTSKLFSYSLFIAHEILALILSVKTIWALEFKSTPVVSSSPDTSMLSGSAYGLVRI